MQKKIKFFNFIKISKQAKIIALQKNPERTLDFLKKIGSNFQIQNQNISFSLCCAWQIVAKSGLGAPCAPFAERSSAHNSSKILNFQKMRRVRDSNPRGLSPACFPSKYHRPLGELSEILFFIAVDKKIFVSTISPIPPQ